MNIERIEGKRAGFQAISLATKLTGGSAVATLWFRRKLLDSG
jgi:hypothetical protein